MWFCRSSLKPMMGRRRGQDSVRWTLVVGDGDVRVEDQVDVRLVLQRPRPFERV
jgi:hypothetical protein